MVRAATALLSLLLAAGCGSGAPDRASERTETVEETRVETVEETRELRVERISSAAPGQGPERPRVILAPSAEALSHEIGAEVPDSGEGTYLAVYWGQKPTGGYSLAVRFARLEREHVTVGLALREPLPDAIVTQALTYPYAVAVVKDLDPEGKRFSFVTGDGEKLGWPVRRASD